MSPLKRSILFVRRPAAGRSFRPVRPSPKASSKSCSGHGPRLQRRRTISFEEARCFAEGAYLTPRHRLSPFWAAATEFSPQTLSVNEVEDFLSAIDWLRISPA